MPRKLLWVFMAGIREENARLTAIKKKKKIVLSYTDEIPSKVPCGDNRWVFRCQAVVPSAGKQRVNSIDRLDIETLCYPH